MNLTKFLKTQIFVWSLLIQSFPVFSNDLNMPKKPSIDVGIKSAKADGSYDNSFSNQVTRTFMHTDRWISSALTAALIATIGTTVLRCEIGELAYDIWPAAAAGGLLVVGDVMTFGMYKGMLNINYDSHNANMEQNRMTDEQRQNFLTLRKSYEDVKIMLETRRNFYAGAGAALMVSSFMALFNAMKQEMKEFSFRAKMDSFVNSLLTNGPIRAGAACVAENQGTPPPILIACTEGKKQKFIVPAIAKIVAAKKQVDKAMNDLKKVKDSNFEKDANKEVERAADKLDKALLEAERESKEKAEQLRREAAAASAKVKGVVSEITTPEVSGATGEITIMKLPVAPGDIPSENSPEISGSEPEQNFVAPVLVGDSANAPTSANEGLIVCKGEGLNFQNILKSGFQFIMGDAYAMMGGGDLFSSWMEGMNPSEALKKENREGTVYKAETIGGVGIGVAGAAIFKFFGKKVDPILDRFWSSPFLRTVVYGAASATVMLGVAMQTAVAMQMDKNISEIDRVLIQSGMSRDQLPPRNTGHSELEDLIGSLPEPVKDNMGVRDGIIMPCPGNADGKGNCDEYPEPGDFSFLPTDLNQQFKTASNLLGKTVGETGGKKRFPPSAFGPLSKLGDQAAIRKMKDGISLIKKKLHEKYPDAGFDSLDSMEKGLLKEFDSLSSQALKQNGLAANASLGSFFTSGGLTNPQEASEEKEGPNFQVPKFDTGNSVSGESQEWNRNYNYDGPSQDSELDGLTKQKFVMDNGNQKEYISGYEEDNIFNIITIRYFKTAYPQLFEEKK